MIRTPFHRAALVALACFAGSAAASQEDSSRRGRDDGRFGPGGYGRFEPSRGPGPPSRREPGPGAYGQAPPPYTPPGYPSPPPRRPLQAGPGGQRIAPLGSVIDTIQRRSPGHELDAALDVQEGRQIYRILWVTMHGRRMELVVDAESGVILSER